MPKDGELSRTYTDKQVVYGETGICIVGKKHWYDDEYQFVKHYSLSEAIFTDCELPRWVWEYFVKLRDNFECVDCWEDNYRKLCAHHIRFVKNHQEQGQHTMSNGKTLCWSCHSKTHGWRRGIKKGQCIPLLTGGKQDQGYETACDCDSVS